MIGNRPLVPVFSGMKILIAFTTSPGHFEPVALHTIPPESGHALLVRDVKEIDGVAPTESRAISVRNQSKTIP